jgi:hypothetical protein
MAASPYKEKTEYEFNGSKKEPDATDQVFCASPESKYTYYNIET